jgi:hypothetical protein
MWLLIAAANGACVRAGGEDIPLSAVIELINSIKKERNHALESGLLHVLYRIFDMSIIGDVKIQRLVRYWDAVSPYADEKIRERLIELLGREPSEEYVRYLRKCLASAREGRCPTGLIPDTLDRADA